MPRTTLMLLLLLAALPARAQWRPFALADNGVTLEQYGVALEAGAGYNGVVQPGAAHIADERRFDMHLLGAVGLTDRIEIGAAVTLAENPERGFGFGDGLVEMRVRVVDRPGGVPLRVAVGAGYQVDGRTDQAVEGMVAVSGELGRVTLAGNVRGAHYFAAARDAVDLSVAAAASVRATQNLHLGVEYLGEDLEGLTDPNELDVGRWGRHYVGPSAALYLGDGGRVRLGATAGAVMTSARSGALARASVAYLF